MALWGHPFTEPYPGEPFYWLDPQVSGVLVSSRAGWLSWHPWHAVLVLLVCVSWPSYSASRAGRAVFAAALFAVIAMTTVNAAWSTWTFGFVFGHRGFLALLPVLTLTVAPALEHLRATWRTRWPRVSLESVAMPIVIVLVAWNAYVWTGFNLIVMRQHGSEPTLVECISRPVALIGQM